MTTIKQVVAAVLRMLGLKSWADRIVPPTDDSAGGPGPRPGP